jgi:hypothetical protein
MEAEQEGSKSWFLDHDGGISGVDPADLSLIPFLPGRQGLGDFQWIHVDIHQVEMRLAALPVQEVANWLLPRFACDPCFLLRLDPRSDVILLTLHGPALRHGPPA